MSTTPVDRLNAALEGRYRIESELGEGGMATVYLADDLRHERKVALKVLRPELAAVVGAERFLAEIKTTANLQHPHILPLFDSGEADSFLFYVMPFVQGETLRGKIEREKQLGVKESLSITRKIANALDYAHDHGVVHRDIKPANVLLSEQGEPLVADFGIALAVAQAGGGRITETGLSLGTPYYMSPEQATGDRDIDPRSDVDALGCVLYEMLSGDPPFSASSAQAVLVKILTSDAPPITRARRTVPPNVEGALAQALEKLPADRFASAAEFSRALEDEGFTYRPRPTVELERGVPTAEPALPSVAEGRPWIRDGRSIAAVAAVVLLGALAVVGGSAQPDDLPRLRLSLDVGAVVFDPRSDLVISPDGDMFAMAGTAEGGAFLYTRRSSDAEFSRVPGTEGARYPVFSPDGEWIAFRDGGTGAILKVSLDGGAPLTVLPAGVVNNPVFLHWGDNGTIVFLDAPEGTLYQVDDVGGEPRALLEGTGGTELTATLPHVLPGGRAILLTDQQAGSITLLDLESDSVRPIVAQGLDGTYIETGHLLYAHPQGGLFAVPFDLSALEVTGEPVPVLDGVWTGSLLGSARARYAVSRNGTLVYGVGGPAAADPERELLVIEPGGPPNALPLPRQLFGAPRWSPDGRSVVYYGGEGESSNIFTYDVEVGTIPRQLTFQGRNIEPVWSPDGARIAFSSQRDGSDGLDLYVKSVDSDAPETQLLTMPGAQFTRAWPQAELIMFESGARTEIWTLEPVDGGEASAYLASDADLDDGVLSPDGRWVAYQSDETGIEEVFVRSFPEPGQQIRVSDGGGQFPRWGPDGASIYYWTAEDDPTSDTLAVARYADEPTFTVLSREPVLVGNYAPESWDLHPDGDRILVAQSQGEEGAASARFMVVVNWFQELRQRLPS